MQALWAALDAAEYRDSKLGKTALLTDDPARELFQQAAAQNP